MQFYTTNISRLAWMKKCLFIGAALVVLSFAMLTVGTASTHAATSSHQAIIPFASGGGCNTVAPNSSAPVNFKVCVSENTAQQIVSNADPIPFGTPGLYTSCNMTVNLVDTTANHEYFGILQNCLFAVQHGGGDFSGPLPPAITGHHYHTHVTFILNYNGTTYTDDAGADLNSPTQIA